MHDAFMIIWNIISLTMVTFLVSMFKSTVHVFPIKPNIVIPIGPLLLMPKSKPVKKLMSHHELRSTVFVSAPIWPKVNFVYAISLKAPKCMAVFAWIILNWYIVVVWSLLWPDEGKNYKIVTGLVSIRKNILASSYLTVIHPFKFSFKYLIPASILPMWWLLNPEMV